MILIAPSILAGNLACLKDEVIKAEEGKADMIHLDVMDGNFAPNITFGFGTIKALRSYTNLPFDAHLMILNPLKYIDKFMDAGSDIVTVHIEVCNEEQLKQIIDKVKAKGKRLGIALNPDTNLPDWLMSMLDDIHLMNVMSVFPGFSGQKMIPEAIDKMANIHNMLKEQNAKVMIEADGGVDASNVMKVVRAGAEIIVAGNAVYGKDDVAKAIEELRNNAMLAREMR